MLHQMSGLSLKSPLRLFTALVFHLLLLHSCKGQNQLIGSSQPIVATVGDDIILPCHLKPAVDVTEDTLEWTRPDLNPRYVHIWRSGVDLVNTQHPSYKGRTSLITEELKHGNISLKLSKVKLSDEGTYKCHMPWINKQSLVELVVGAASSLVISLAGIDTTSSRVVLQCESKGWYPEPEVFWLDGERKLLSAGPTETVRGPDDLYTVISRVTVEKRHSNNFTCRVQQNHINQTRETHLIVPDEFFMFQSNSTVSIYISSAVSLAVCILLIFAFVFFVWRQNKRKKMRSCMDIIERGESNETKMQVAEAAETKSLMKTQRVSTNNKETKCIKTQHDELQQLRSELKTLKKKKLETKKKKELEESENPHKSFLKRRKKNEPLGQVKEEVKTLEKKLQTKEDKFDMKINQFNDQQQLQQEQQRRKEAENKVENMKQKLEKMKQKLKNVKQELKNIKQELETMKQENVKVKTQNDELLQLRSELETKKKKLETKKNKLETKKKELEESQNPHKRFSWLFSTNEPLEQVKQEVETLEKKLQDKQEEFHMKLNQQHQQHKGKR